MRHRRRGNLPEQAIYLRQCDTNAYTIEKKGIRKMIYQTAWRREDGTVGGIIELSMPIPAEMPHYVRG